MNLVYSVLLHVPVKLSADGSVGHLDSFLLVQRIVVVVVLAMSPTVISTLAWCPIDSRCLDGSSQRESQCISDLPFLIIPACLVKYSEPAK